MCVKIIIQKQEDWLKSDQEEIEDMMSHIMCNTHLYTQYIRFQ